MYSNADLSGNMLLAKSSKHTIEVDTKVNAKAINADINSEMMMGSVNEENKTTDGQFATPMTHEFHPNDLMQDIENNKIVKKRPKSKSRQKRK